MHEIHNFIVLKLISWYFVRLYCWHSNLEKLKDLIQYTTTAKSVLHIFIYLYYQYCTIIIRVAATICRTRKWKWKWARWKKIQCLVGKEVCVYIQRVHALYSRRVQSRCQIKEEWNYYSEKKYYKRVFEHVRMKENRITQTFGSVVISS